MNRPTHSHNTISFRLLALCLLALMTACADRLDDETTAKDGEDNTVYTLNLAIDAMETSRNATTGFPVKDHWLYGDKVTLARKSSSTETYEFEIPVPTGKSAGDPVEERVATFTHTGKINNATSFSGTLTYTPEESEATVYPWGDGKGVKSCIVQSSNDNADHIACLNELTATLSSVNLKASRTILLKRKYGLIKVMLSGFIYPLANGSAMWVNGFEQITGFNNSGLGLVLGNWTAHTVSSMTHSGDNYPRETLHGEPFLNVSDTKDPLTRYAVNDGRKLIAYIPFSTERTMRAKNKLSVMVVDEWSKDIYVWSVKVPGEMKYKAGNFYTLDLTYIEPDIAIEAIWPYERHNFSSKYFGYVRTKNIGAATPADAGYYYMFGQRYRIQPEEHYPGYPSATPYYYFRKNSDGESAVYCRDLSTHIHTYITLGGGGGTVAIEKYKDSATGEFQALSYLWKNRLSADFENLLQYCGSRAVSDNVTDDEQRRATKNEWMIVKHSSTNNFTKPEYRFYDNETVAPDGSPTTDRNLAVGIRMTIHRTGHSLFFPVCGILEPSALTTFEDEPMIAPEAVARPYEINGESKYVAIVEESVVSHEISADERDITVAIDVFNLQGNPERHNVPLYFAMPIRPIYDIYGRYPKDLIDNYNKL